MLSFQKGCGQHIVLSWCVTVLCILLIYGSNLLDTCSGHEGLIIGVQRMCTTGQELVYWDKDVLARKTAFALFGLAVK